MGDNIDLSNLEFHEKLGEGAFGTVSRVTFKTPYRGLSEAAAKSIISLRSEEVEIMRKLQHPHIVRLIAFYCNGPINMILIEYAKNGSLHEYLSCEFNPLPEDLMRKWAKESALAIQYLHYCKCLHRDIKPQNCLLFENNVLKLCDFGLAREIDHTLTISSQKGSYQYMAPEIIGTDDRKRATYSIFTDIYAYGMLLLAICSRKPPFHGMNFGYVIYQVGNGKIRPAMPLNCPQDLSELMRRCWNVEPTKRPTIDAVLGALSVRELRKQTHQQHQVQAVAAEGGGATALSEWEPVKQTLPQYHTAKPKNSTLPQYQVEPVLQTFSQQMKQTLPQYRRGPVLQQTPPQSQTDPVLKTFSQYHGNPANQTFSQSPVEPVLKTFSQHHLEPAKQTLQQYQKESLLHYHPQNKQEPALQSFPQYRMDPVKQTPPPYKTEPVVNTLPQNQHNQLATGGSGGETGTWKLVKESITKLQERKMTAARVTCAPNGDMVVAGANNGELYILASDGEYKMSLRSNDVNSRANYQTTVRRVLGLSVSSHGHVLVVDGTKFVKVFDISGKYLHCFHTLFPDDDPKTKVSLLCVGIDTEGHVLLGDWERNIITIHASSGREPVAKLKCNMTYLSDMVINSKKHILCCYDPLRSVYPKIVARDYSGYELFTFTPKLEVHSEEIIQTMGMTCDADDNIYVALCIKRGHFIDNSGHIHKYSPTGTFLKCIAEGLYKPYDLAIASNGSLVVANGHSVLIYNLR